jgi:hypothetical protein
MMFVLPDSESHSYQKTPVVYLTWAFLLPSSSLVVDSFRNDLKLPEERSSAFRKLAHVKEWVRFEIVALMEASFVEDGGQDDGPFRNAGEIRTRVAARIEERRYDMSVENRS